jgi:hypothetical protein
MQKRVESYTFGVIVVGGVVHRADLAITPDGEVDGAWWRKNVHKLTAADIKALVAAKPEVLVVGTGARGEMEVDPTLEEKLKKKGVELCAAPTSDAIKTYNKLRRNRKVAACFHLTC